MTGSPRAEPTARRAVRTAAALAVATFVPLASCGDGPTGPGRESLRIVVVSGSGQLGEPGTTLPAPMEVQVVGPDGEPRAGRGTTWEIVRGAGARLSEVDGPTNALGKARASLTLGPEPGRHEVRVSLRGGRADPVELWARGVRRPALTGASPDPLHPGGTVILTGGNFIPELERIVVLFSGIRGRVVEGTSSSLEVEVPVCLTGAPVEIEVALGSLRSDPLPAAVDGPGTPVALDPGRAATVRDSLALSCLRLPGDAGGRYLAVVHSSDSDGLASHSYDLVLRGGGAVAARPAPAPGRVEAPHPVTLDAFRRRPGEGRIRRLERRAASRARIVASTSGPAAARIPATGDRRTFSVLAPSGGFESVTAEVEWVGERAVVYVDLDTPEGGFEAGDLATLGGLFEDPIHPTVTGVFGAESDLDGNGRVIVLFTPVVNRQTEPGSDGFVGGFFFGVDLLPDREGSNGGEIFYALVPDPDGRFGDPRSRDDVLLNLPAILAHELQHMVHFNQRVLELEADGTEALWLSEALATSSEDLVADVFLDRGDPDRAWTLRSGNYVRASRYLEAPSPVSVVVTEGEGSLAERGAGWLLLRYLRGRSGGVELLSALTRTRRTGVENVTATTGVPWSSLVEGWTGALYLDGLGLPVGERYLFAEFDLRGELSRVDGRFPLDPPTLGSTDRILSGAVRASTAAFYLLEPAGSEGLAVNLAGPGSGALPGRSLLGLTLVRLR